MKIDWKDVSTFLHEEREKSLQKLASETQLEEIYRLQGEIRRFRWFASLPELMQEARKAQIEQQKG